ncbi:uncharacterized protein LY89DRAFT_707001 [Mollisia scopiformis]|uniref:Uncharacterized protein n=1 Tax=Mollisia scopiformis TaxID=149040 RepID=A0A194XB70_MOLSC|nr:uncharacterized protein LY89DRAFT_707001 [Mollisia scopiformis]KUJ17420.1 hypothetical protein LY89DRAFT_707001 [Mollisia scopiformis]
MQRSPEIKDNTAAPKTRANPGDILSLLLLIGGDIVQKAIAQMQPSRALITIPITPVAFSFGWVAFGFSQLLSAVGDRRLLPAPEDAAIIVNCANSFQRENKSWLLDRLLRDHEIRNHIDEDKDSIKISIFELGPLRTPKPDHVWMLGWATMLAEIGIAIPPWVLYGDWGVMMIVLAGTVLAMATCSLAQWREEKWAGRLLDHNNVICLTRGNGHKHVMVLLGRAGSPDIEAFATARGAARHETPVVTAILAALWVCLLLSVSGLKDHAWYLIGAGGLGMLQNVYAAGAARSSSTTGLELKDFKRMPSITAKSQGFKDDPDSNVWLENGADPKNMPKWVESMKKVDGVPEWLEPVQEPQVILRVHGALKELEKWVPGAGLAMTQVFFPSHLKYEDESVRDNVNKKIWRRAWHTNRVRRHAEQARRKVEGITKPKTV